MKVQLLLLFITSTGVTLSVGGKFAIKEDLTLLIEINLIGFLVISSTILAMLYIGSPRSVKSSVPESSAKPSTQTPEIQKSTQEEEKHQRVENPAQSENTEVSERPPVHSILKYRKSSLRSEDSVDQSNDDYSQRSQRHGEDDDSDEQPVKKRSMSLPQMNKEVEPEGLKMQRKVSFNEKQNTVHRYRKNSRQEKRNYESGEKELKKQKKLKAESKENTDTANPRRKLKARKGKGLQHEKQNSKNRHYHCTEEELNYQSDEFEDEKTEDRHLETSG